MRSFERLEQLWAGRPAAPRERGAVRLVVARKGKGVHDVLERGQLTPEDGLVGDRWREGSSPSLERQITMMEATVAELVADGQPLHLPGDNLLVELDLGIEAAPAGTRLRVGTALLEVSDKPHTGCKKFEARFGADALRWINADEHAAERLRGINCRVVEAGDVAPGDVVENLGPSR